MPHLQLRHKLLLALMIVIASFVLAVNQYVFSVLDEVTETRIADSVTTSKRVWETFEQARLDLLRQRAGVFARLPGLGDPGFPALANPDTPPPDAPLLLRLDADGSIQSVIAGNPADGLTLPPAARSDFVNHRRPHAGYLLHEGEPYRFVITPLAAAGNTAGGLLVGERFGSAADLEALRDLSSARIALVVGGRLHYPAPSAIGPTAAAAMTAAVLAGAHAPGGQSHAGDMHLGVAQVTDGVLLAFHVSHQAFDKRSEEVRSGIWIASFITLLLGALLSRQIAAHVTRPLDHLTRAATAFGRGDTLQDLPTDSRDEIGALAKAFWAMARKIDLEQRSLIHAKEAAEAASRAKSTFLATISQEIRTPLNGIVGMAALLEQTTLTRKQTHYCDAVISSSRTLLAILNDVLDLTKIEAGQFQIDPHDIQPSQMIDECVQPFMQGARVKGLNFEYDNRIPASLVLRADGVRLRQVLSNLLGNAVKFTEHGTVRLSVQVLEPGDDTTRIRFEVADTGPGMDAVTAARVFDAFTQADGSMSRQYGGTGLGLTISRQIIELMRGSLQVETRPGEGARFWFDLTMPVVEGATAPDMAGLRIRLTGVEPDAQLQLTRILPPWGLQIVDGSEPFDIQIVGDETAMPADAWGRPSVYLVDPDRVGSFEPRQPGLHSVTPAPAQPSALFDTLTHLLSRMQISNRTIRQTPELHRFDGLTALLAEDNPVNQEVAEAALALMGVAVIRADNGAQAIEAFQRVRPAFVLMDCQMPEVDGLEATRRIRQAESGSRTPIFALTANAFESDRQACLAAGMDDFLGKPFAFADLSDLLARWFTPATGTGTAPPALPLSAREPEPSHSPLSRDALDNLRGLTTPEGKNLLDRVIDLYLSSTPSTLADMETALAAGDGATLGRHAHSLKSAYANLGARELAARYAGIEQAVARGDLSGLSIADLRLAHAQLVPWIESERTAPANAPSGRPGRESTPASADAAHHKPASRPADRLVLVVDDDPAFRLSMRSALLPHGFEVIDADGGESAYEASLIRVPDLMLVDAVMPGMDGYETCQRFRADPLLSDVPILMVTALDDQHSVDKAFASGASGFIAKPVQYAALGHHVRFMVRASETTKALKENQQQLVTAQRLASLGYWRWHVHSGEFEVSRHFLGEAPIGTIDSLDGFAACVVDEDRPGFLADIGRALEEQTTLETSYRMYWGERLVHIHQHLSRDGLGRKKAVLVGTIQDVTARREAEDQVRRLAYYDALTGLSSRTFLYERIGEMIRSARRRKIGFTVLFLDLDGFKDVNDTQGHSAGDAMLKVVADRLVASVRDNDFVARFGGDEFCILLEDLEDEMHIRMIAGRCLEEVSAGIEIGDVMVKPRISIGIARYPFDAEDLNGLLRAADSAMYEAKANGKHRFEYYDAAMTARAEQRFLLAQQLREALVHGQFEMYYQPQVSLTDGSVTGFEALARWNHPERGVLPPSEFIAELTHLKLINDFESWAVRHVCRQIALWQEAGVEVPVAVNISAEHFRKSVLPDIVATALAEAGVPADRLVLEVTESAMQYTDEAIRVLHLLRDMGVKVAIDDFGTGFSSLGSLQHLPVQNIKIDRIFIRDLTEVPKDAIMLGTIVTLAHALGFRIIAEGVENTAQIQILSGLECDTVQGFFFSRPVQAEQVPDMARQRFATSLEHHRRRLASG